MQKLKQAATRAVELINVFGFALIVGSVIYFILGNVAKLVGGHMLDWTFCGSWFHLTGTECHLENLTGEEAIDAFFHHLFTVTTLPWFTLFWGFVLTGGSAILLKLLDYTYRPPGHPPGSTLDTQV